ncbi:putative ammonium transporter 2 isoform X2 [Athalia rosae]|uniref:putative ammonium transporter 2 isoform X2 n=1 Tax=Athalia rosae TaxID=37344 RepID=UPI0020334D6B|nr:putative ammonium transporter 2 isoform X2 [Athalia rosae]
MEELNKSLLTEFRENLSMNGNDTIDDLRYVSSIYNLNQEDTIWLVTSSFIIFTMQTGFGMLESGCVSLKNEVNIMMKNVVDIVLGGLTYWLFGFGMSFGREEPGNPFVGVGGYLIDPSIDDELMGSTCAAFLFQLSFATTATTIVSGAMAERCNFKAYCLFSLLNTVVYCIPAGWVWGDHGFLKRMGVVDIAGSGPVHLIGGVSGEFGISSSDQMQRILITNFQRYSALAGAMMLGPRLGRYDRGTDPLPLGCPVNAVMGMFVLWWGWLAFNSGSTYGVSGERWKYAARAAVSTMMGSMGGGLVGLIFSLINPKGIDILSQINGILGALVAVTGGCFLYQAWEALVVGAVGGLIACLTMPALDRLGIDDPVGASSVHGMRRTNDFYSISIQNHSNFLSGAAGVWGVLAVGLFAGNPLPLNTTNGRTGLFKGGGWYLFGVQCLSGLCLGSWSFLTSIILLWIVNKLIPIRMDMFEELLGADLVEHRIRHVQIGVSRAMSTLRPFPKYNQLEDVTRVGINPGHEDYLDTYKREKKAKKLMKMMGRNYNQSKQGKSSGLINRRIFAINDGLANPPLKSKDQKLGWIN